MHGTTSSKESVYGGLVFDMPRIQSRDLQEWSERNGKGDVYRTEYLFVVTIMATYGELVRASTMDYTGGKSVESTRRPKRSRIRPQL